MDAEKIATIVNMLNRIGQLQIDEKLALTNRITLGGSEISIFGGCSYVNKDLADKVREIIATHFSEIRVKLEAEYSEL